MTTAPTGVVIPPPQPITVHKGASLAAAAAAMIAGKSMILERGGVFPEPLAIAAGQLCGTAKAPITIEPFGTGPAPVVCPKMVHAAELYGAQYLTVRGIDFAPTYDGSPTVVYGFSLNQDFWHGGTPPKSLLFEDCTFRGATRGCFISNGVDATFRRCRFLDCDRADFNPPHCTGAYLDYMSGTVLFEDCLFDHDGWLPHVQRHLLYLQYNNLCNATLRRCIFARGGGDAVQFRCGGLIEDCLFIRNPMCGPIADGGIFRNNVVYGTRNVLDNVPDLSRAHGPQFVGGIIGRTFQAYSNILIDDRTDSPVNRAGVSFNGVVIPTHVYDNLFDGWLDPLVQSFGYSGNLLSQQNNTRISRPGVRFGPYLAAKGKAPGSVPEETFLALARAGDPIATAAAFNGWVRSGYGTMMAS